MFSSNWDRDYPELIIIDDDNSDDAQRYSSRSSAEVVISPEAIYLASDSNGSVNFSSYEFVELRQLEPLTLFPSTSSWVISEEDLELRLGSRGDLTHSYSFGASCFADMTSYCCICFFKHILKL